MINTPPEATRPSGNDPHQHRQLAESFGSDAERYNRTRPRYPDELVRRIVEASPGPDILDVGCGTGIAARQFQAAGRTVLGIEPDARMAVFARSSGVEVEQSTFEKWNPTGRTFDAVIAAQTWHWVDPDAGAAKAARVLLPGGLLALFWHTFQPPAAVLDAFVEVYQRVVPDSPLDVEAMKRPGNGYQPMLDKAADGFRRTGGFGAPEQWRFDWERSYTRKEWLDQLPTQGTLTRLRPDQVTAVLAHVGAAIDEMGGGFTMHGNTMAVAATRTTAA